MLYFLPGMIELIITSMDDIIFNTAFWYVFIYLSKCLKLKQLQDGRLNWLVESLSEISLVCIPISHEYMN